MISDEECRLLLLARTEPGAREVYMDWLLEHDARRGQLLQTQLRGARLTPDEWTEYWTLWRAALEIPDTKAPKLVLDPLPSSIELDSDQLTALEVVLERLPFLHINLDCTNTAFDHPVFANVRQLTLWAYNDSPSDENYQSMDRTYYGAYALGLLCASPHVSQLETLWLLDQEFGEQAAALVANGPFRNLRELSIHDEPVGDNGAKALAEAPTMATLRRLTLSGCRIGDAGALAIARSPFLKLEELRLMDYERLAAETLAELRALPLRKLEVPDDRR